MDLDSPLKLIADVGDMVQQHPSLSMALAFGALVAFGAFALVLRLAPGRARIGRPEAVSPALRSLEGYVREVLTERPRCEVSWQRIAAALRAEGVLPPEVEPHPVEAAPGRLVRDEIASWAARHGWGVEWNGKSERLVVTWRPAKRVRRRELDRPS